MKPINTRRVAIEQHCKNCIYDPINGAGTWRQQVGNCNAFSCALFNFRPTPALTPNKDLNALKISGMVENRPTTDQYREGGRTVRKYRALNKEGEAGPQYPGKTNVVLVTRLEDRTHG